MNYKIYKILCDIVAETYKDADEEKLQKYKKFHVELQNRELKSKLGDYCMQTKAIRIFGLSRDSKFIVRTCLHELAHHIDNMNRGTSDHSDLFYAEYRKLMYTALNMRILTPEMFENADNNDNSSDKNKVMKMLDEWIPEYVEYKEGEKIISVKNCYERKDVLKARGYKWNGVNSTWEKEFNNEDLYYEIDYLTNDSFIFHVTDAAQVSIEASGYIVVTGNSFPCKDILKENGFFFTNKKWKKKCKMSEIKEEMKRVSSLPECSELTFKIQNK